MALAVYDKTLVSEKLVEEVEKALDRPGTKAAALAAVRGQRFSEQQQKYKTIDKPTLLLWGREDVVTTLKMGERLSKDLPRARLVVYPQCGHFPMIEAQRPSTLELVTFLAVDDKDDAKVEAPKDSPKEARKDGPKDGPKVDAKKPEGGK
jgi:4,5:9,10-diseco-3-hydroxy-5,9,17-trioxoandrosta-1(10),2-diene-4-oate hydrolase